MSKNKQKTTVNEDRAEMETSMNENSAENNDKNSEVSSVETENMAGADTLTDFANQENQGEANEQIMAQVKEWQEKYIRLSADFDNFRKRTMREKMDLIKTAGEDVLVSILPVIDDFERALKVMEGATEIKAVKEGVELIYTKFNEILSQKGLNPIDSLNQEFNTDLHEAITKIPAPDDSLKGKIVDVVQKGYMLQDKVVRFAKVVVGE